jgi:hypothetical protein
MRKSGWITAVFVVALACNAQADDPSLVLRGIGDGVIKLTTADIQKLPSRTIRATPEHRSAADYKCTTVGEVLTGSGLQMGKNIRGKRLGDYLRVKAADGYEAVFALPELDPEFTDRLVLLCYLKDGAALPADEGPLRIVIPEEKRPARWVRQVTEFVLEKRP